MSTSFSLPGDGIRPRDPVPKRAFPVPLSEQIDEVRRELAMRQTVYGERVAAGTMSKETAALYVDRMAAVLNTLLGVQFAEAASQAAAGPYNQR